jgi:TolA-binding protein
MAPQSPEFDQTDAFSLAAPPRLLTAAKPSQQRAQIVGLQDQVRQLEKRIKSNEKTNRQEKSEWSEALIDAQSQINKYQRGEDSSAGRITKQLKKVAKAEREAVIKSAKAAIRRAWKIYAEKV